MENAAAARMLGDIEAETGLVKHIRQIERLFVSDQIAATATEAFRGAGRVRKQPAKNPDAPTSRLHMNRHRKRTRRLATKSIRAACLLAT